MAMRPSVVGSPRDSEMQAADPSDVGPSYFPPPRPELVPLLRQGDALLNAAMSGVQSVRTGHILSSVGAREVPLYRLMSGEMARIKSIEDGRRQIMMIFLPGDLLNAAAMLFEYQIDDIECLATATVRVLERRSALTLAAEQPSVAIRLLWQLAATQRQLHNTEMLLGRGTAVERVATALIGLYARQTFIGREAAPIALRQQDLADYIGLTLVHVNRTLRLLRDQGVITTRHRRIVVRDLAALHRHAAPMLDLFERARPEFGAPHR
jgi:CRP/FNR family transcriptional regulator